MKECGVYALIFKTASGEKIYIGSTAVSFKDRLRRHLNQFKSGKHRNPYMQNLYNRYGAPGFQILEVCDDHGTVASREQWWIEQIEPSQLLNLGPAIPSPTFGKKYSPEIREKISRAKRGKPGNRSQLGRRHSPETREKMSLAHKGRPGQPHSAETKEKLSLVRRGRKFQPHSEETRKKISKSNRGKSMSQKVHRALLESHLGKPLSPETKKNISEGNKLKWQDPEFRTKMSVIRKATWAKKKAEANND